MVGSKGPRRAALVDGERLVGEAHVAAERRVVERPPSRHDGPPHGVDRDAEPPDGVPHADEVDLGIGMGVHPAEHLGFETARMGVRGAVPVQAVGVHDPTGVLAPQDARVAHEPDRAARRERAAAEPEEVQLVAGLVAPDEEPVAVDDVPREADAERAAGEPLGPPGPNAAL